MAQPRESVYFLLEKGMGGDPLNPDGGDGSIEVRMLNHLSTSLSRGTKKGTTSNLYNGDVAVSVISRFGKEKVSLSPQVSPSNSLSVVGPTVSESETVDELVSKPQASANERPLSVFQPSVSLTPDTLPLTSNYSIHAAATHSAGEAAPQQNGPAEEQHHIIITRNSEFRNPTGTTDEIVIPPVHLDPSGLNHLLSLDCPTTAYSLHFAEFVHSSLSLLRAAAVRIKAEPEKTAEIQAAPKSRLGRFVSTYGDLESLRKWTPTPTERVDDSTFVIKDKTTRIVLGGIGLVPHANRTGIGQIIGLLRRAVQQGNIPSAAGYSLLALPSLKQHLGSRRLSLKTTAVNDEADADADVTWRIWRMNLTVVTTTTHETRLFCRAVASLCAWTTGPNALLGSPIARSTLDITISIRDLPRVPLRKRGKWDSDLRTKAISSLREKYANKQALGSSEGECHCEAALMASIYMQRPQSFQDFPSHIPIGVAKKCCPLCKMLADHFCAWVPPESLPLSVVEELENQMLKVIKAMLEHGKHLKGSRASSPGSDKGTTYYGNTFVTRSVEEDVQSYNR
ncbi:hypothetical protein B0H13DRAFT_1966188 [Mycena leptocephala]|nr:hypothetical protein B0H13DRAFT_1966188 [Mycena leptocephala]